MDGFGITASGGDERSDHQSMRRFVDLLGLGTDEEEILFDGTPSPSHTRFMPKRR